MQFRNFGDVVYGTNNRRVVTRSGYIRNQSTAIGIDQNETGQTPGASRKPNEQFFRLYTAP